MVLYYQRAYQRRIFIASHRHTTRVQVQHHHPYKIHYTLRGKASAKSHCTPTLHLSLITAVLHTHIFVTVLSHITASFRQCKARETKNGGFCTERKYVDLRKNTRKKMSAARAMTLLCCTPLIVRVDLRVCLAHVR